MTAPIRNIAIIAHVDHGKTTLVDFLLKQSGTFHAKAEELGRDLIMDSNDQERERGITILAKNTAVQYQGVKINIVDTPGHADFGGEVERTLNMADGALLLVDAQEGPMPQTKFVLKKALDLGLKVIVVVNKVDKPGAEPERTVHEVSDLFLQLAHDETHLDFPVLYAVGRAGKAWDHVPDAGELAAEGTLAPLFDAILKHVPEPSGETDGPLQMLVAALDRDDYQGRYAIGRIARGSVRAGMSVALLHADGTTSGSRVEKVFVYSGLKRVEVSEAWAGDIVALTGAHESHIGDTLADAANPERLPTIRVEEPTLRISVGPNTGPFVGKEGTLLTGRQIGERLERELETNIGLRMERADGRYLLSGRGELHLSVFIETLRREGFEMEISKPEVIFRNDGSGQSEPVEEVTVDIPEEFAGAVTTEFSKRKAVLLDLINHGNGYSRMTWKMPTRALLGLRSVLMTSTKGTAVINSIYLTHEPLWALPESDRTGALIASEAGQAVSLGLETAQGRGTTFIGPGTQVYVGQIIGQNARYEDLEINVCKGKELTNMRSKSSDGVIILAPPVRMSLEQSLDWLGDDELLEVTPQSLRLRKRHLTRVERDRVKRALKA
ncbi:MAG TPA: translational GTPase TypA [Candidatus Paceibacterota bacterium]|nr:translational GTPase TypA [Candidatus Paceibacterota bacterium]